ncbi:MAG: radical SAM protein [Lachnospiraceae bacterium]|nr:radical SAM protein [Lachnospiraceae bacterium]MBD5511134.1 radical SAM protein [Lachnospiraceae bacterium]
MDKIKRYVECYVPITTCNIQCHYCYITRQGKWKDQITPIGHLPEEIAKALSTKRLGGKCLINLCGGGETLLCPQIAETAIALLEEGHYVMLVTNGTVTKVLEQIAAAPPELLKHLIFKFSYHYLEHHRLGLTERFFQNIKMMRDAGCSFTLEVTPNDELIAHIPEMKEEVQKYLGALCHVTIARDALLPTIPILTELPEEEFYETWGQFDSSLFAFKKTIFGKHQDNFCYAGEWSVYVHLGTGVMTQCYEGRVLDNIYENIEKPLHFEAVGCRCKTYHCYNGHAFLALGDIPELDTPTYAELRDRTDKEGKQWLGEEVHAFLSGKLKDSNKEYSAFKKWMINRKK